MPQAVGGGLTSGHDSDPTPPHKAPSSLLEQQPLKENKSEQMFVAWLILQSNKLLTALWWHVMLVRIMQLLGKILS